MPQIIAALAAAFRLIDHTDFDRNASLVLLKNQIGFAILPETLCMA